MTAGNRLTFAEPRRPFRRALSTKQWRATRKAIKARDGYCCEVRGAPEIFARTKSGRTMTNLQVGHRIPAERYPGGHNDPANLWTLCRGCNASQGNRTPDEWRAAASGRLVRLGLVRQHGGLVRTPGGRAVITGDYSRRKP